MATVETWGAQIDVGSKRAKRLAVDIYTYLENRAEASMKRQGYERIGDWEHFIVAPFARVRCAARKLDVQ